MAVYSVLKPETDILDMLKEYDVKDLIIIVCGGCANESLAYFRREPIFKSTNNRRLCDSPLRLFLLLDAGSDSTPK